MLKKEISIDGLVLAGGESRRFGSDKALFRLKGSRLIDISIALLESKFERVLVSLGIRDCELPRSVTRIFDSVPNRGPLQGIFEAMRESSADWLFVSPCDMPFISENLIDLLISADLTNLDAVVAMDSSRRVIPVLGLYRVELADCLEERLVNGDYRGLGFLEELNYLSIEGSKTDLRNVNWKSDLDS